MAKSPSSGYCEKCASETSMSSVFQTLDEMDFERGIWGAGKKKQCVVTLCIYICIFHKIII